MLNSAQLHYVLRGDAAGARSQVTDGPTGLKKEARKSARVDSQIQQPLGAAERDKQRVDRRDRQ